MRVLFLVTLLLFGVNSVLFAQGLRLKLSEALKNKMVAVTAVATGKSYKEHGLRLKLENRTGSLIRLTMDLGGRFSPEDSAYQPLLLVGEEVVQLQGWKTQELQVRTFCGHSKRSAPVAGNNYSWSGVVGDTLVRVLQYVKKNFLLDDLGQSAVWVFTNNHSLRSVYDPARDRASKQLIDHIVSVSGLPQPEYYTVSEMSDEPGHPVYEPKVLKIIAQFEEKLDAPKSLTLGVYNTAGEIVQPVFENRTFGKAGHRFKVEFEASNVPAGKYYIRLKEGDKVLQEKMVTVE